MSVEFKDFSMKVKSSMGDAVEQFLIEAASEVTSAAQQISRVDTGQLKGSWEYKVDLAAGEATVGSPLENAIWEEFGTGEYAAKGNGRKGGWAYVDAKGVGHFTHGKRPRRTLQRAFDSNRSKIKARAEQIIKGKMS